MTIPTIAIIRATRLLSDDLVQSFVRSLQLQITRDFEPAWNQDAHCVFVSGGQPIPKGSWEIWLQDHSNQAGALGFHTDDGDPRAYVGVGDALRDEVSWTVTCSHEALEMLADPEINKTVTIDGIEYPVEVCDTCEDDRFAYPVAGHHLSAFALPSWFGLVSGAPYTFPAIPEINAPLALGEGGYIGERPVGGTWSQRFASEARTARMTKGPASRTLRRFNVPSATVPPTM